jgi:hypothetical protein
MKFHANTLHSPGLSEPENIYQKRIKYGRILLVWIVCAFVVTALVGMVVIGLFAPSALWTVAVACALLLLSGIVTIAFIVYWAFRSYQLTRSTQPIVGEETGNTKHRPSHVIDTQVHIIEVHPDDRK